MSWVARAVSIPSSLVLMPVLFRWMNQEELGLWFLLGNSVGFLGLLGFGVGPILTRHIALAKGKSGSDPDVPLTPETRQHIADLVVTGQRLLAILAVWTFIAALLAGYLLLEGIELHSVSRDRVLAAWAIMSLSFAVTTWVGYLDCYIQGIGYVGWDNMIATCLGLFTTIANIVAVVSGGGLVSLAAIAVVSGLTGRFALLAFIRRRRPELFGMHGTWRTEYVRVMLKPALLCWLTGLGAFLILRTQSYFIALFQGAAELPGFQAMQSLVINVYMLAVLFAAASSVFISQAWEAGDLAGVQRLTLRNVRLGLGIGASGVVFLLKSGEDLINLWLGPGHFVGWSVLLVLCVTWSLETQHVILSSGSRATDDEKFAPWALGAGVLNLILSYLLIRPLGLLGLVLALMFSQMLTNNWYAVYRPLVRLQIPFRVYFKQGILFWLAVFIASTGMAWLIKRGIEWGGLAHSVWSVGGVAAACGCVLAGAVWFGVLEPGHRAHIASRISGTLKWSSAA